MESANFPKKKNRTAGGGKIPAVIRFEYMIQPLSPYRERR